VLRSQTQLGDCKVEENTMAIDILMPALSPTMEEGALAKWLVKVGDTVKSGDVIAEIETDKATMEVEAVDEGEVLELVVPAGAQGVKVNAVIARIAGEGGAPVAAVQVPPSAPSGSTSPASGGGRSSSAAVGELHPPPLAGEVTRSAGGGNGAPDARILASPLARRIAGQSGIDLSTLTGSGPNGRIIKVDVEAAMGRTPVAAPAVKPQDREAPAVSAAPQPKAPAPLPYAEGTYRLVPLDGMRRTIARRMTDSFRDVPHFPLNIDLEIDALLALRKELNAQLEGSGVKLSVNDLVIRAAALACRKVPEANASYSPDGLLVHNDAHIAVAVAVEGGLVTPVIRAAQTKGLAEISSEMVALADKARARKLMPEDYAGGTFSISNLGMMGIRSFASILNEPQGCILSVGAGEQRPVVKNGALAIATVMSVTLTCDHRVVDGAVGAAWLKAFRGLIEQPLGMML
jgi:pyruvate dehydrogenase E2 component (dihydrolipoamide acetyltransferase)